MKFLLTFVKQIQTGCILHFKRQSKFKISTLYLFLIEKKIICQLYWKVKLVKLKYETFKVRCHYQSLLCQSCWWNFESDNGQRNLWSKTLTNFDGIELHPIFLQTLMEINQSEYCFGMMRWCLQNKSTW